MVVVHEFESHVANGRATRKKRELEAHLRGHQLPNSALTRSFLSHALQEARSTHVPSSVRNGIVVLIKEALKRDLPKAS